MEKNNINYLDLSDKEIEKLIEDGELDEDKFEIELIEDLFNKRGKILVSESEFFYKDKVGYLEDQILAEIYARLRLCGYTSEQINKMFPGNEDTFSCSIRTIEDENFVLHIPRDLISLWNLLQAAYDPDIEDLVWLPNVEDEYITAKVINNAICQMISYGIPKNKIIKILGVYYPDINNALKHGMLDIYTRADEDFFDQDDVSCGGDESTK